MILSKEKKDQLDKIRSNIYLKHGKINTSYKRDTFKHTLDFFMVEYNLRNVDISMKTSIPESVISEYLSGEYTPRGINLYKLSKLFSVNPDWFIGLSNSMLDNNIEINNIEKRENFLDIREISLNFIKVTNSSNEDSSIYINMFENIAKLNRIGLERANCIIIDLAKINEYLSKD